MNPWDMSESEIDSIVDQARPIDSGFVSRLMLNISGFALGESANILIEVSDRIKSEMDDSVAREMEQTIESLYYPID